MTKSIVKVKITQSCPTLCNPMDYAVHWILQVRILDWVTIPFSRGSSQPGIKPRSLTLQVDFVLRKSVLQKTILCKTFSWAFNYRGENGGWERMSLNLSDMHFLKHSFIEIQFKCHMIHLFKVYNLLVLSIFTKLHHHYQKPVLEHFQLPKRNFVPINSVYTPFFPHFCPWKLLT